MNDHQLDKLIRTINPASFSEAVNGDGYRFVHSRKNGIEIHKRRALSFLGSSADETHYFVKKLATPLVVDSWEFHWAEGTSAIALDFLATFELHARDEKEAFKLTSALHQRDGVEAALRALIGQALHEEMQNHYRVHKAGNKNLLAMFKASSVGVGESEDMNQEISRKVGGAIGNLPFRIGFKLLNLPPLLVEIKEQRDSFTLADSKVAREVITNAQLEFDNYQNYGKANLETVKAVQDAISLSISQAVRRHLFGKKYYEVIGSFSNEENPIQKEMQSCIVEDAKRIGYKLNIFHTFPDIAALSLVAGMRIDLPESRFEYQTKNSAGHVHMALALSVNVSNFQLLDRVISPDDADVEERIRLRVHEICFDVVQDISRMEFNLEFQNKVTPKLTEAITENLAKCGLSAEIISIRQSETEEAKRFKAICGQPVKFNAPVTYQTKAGTDELMIIQGRIEVTGMRENGWERFISKDFGYREDSQWTSSKLLRRAQDAGIECEVIDPLPASLRKSLAVEFELSEVRDAVCSEIKGKLSKKGDLLELAAASQDDGKLEGEIRKMAREAIGREFGLAIDLNGLLSDNDDKADALIFQRQMRIESFRTGVQQGIDLDKKKFDEFASGKVALIKENFELQKQLMRERSGNDSEDLAALEKKMAGEMANLLNEHSLTQSSTRNLLKGPQSGSGAPPITNQPSGDKKSD